MSVQRHDLQATAESDSGLEYHLIPAMADPDETDPERVELCVKVGPLSFQDDFTADQLDALADACQQAAGAQRYLNQRSQA